MAYFSPTFLVFFTSCNLRVSVESWTLFAAVVGALFHFCRLAPLVPSGAGLQSLHPCSGGRCSPRARWCRGRLLRRFLVLPAAHPPSLLSVCRCVCARTRLPLLLAQGVRSAGGERLGPAGLSWASPAAAAELCQSLSQLPPPGAERRVFRNSWERAFQLRL